jgi:hypothetical protein
MTRKLGSKRPHRHDFISRLPSHSRRIRTRRHPIRPRLLVRRVTETGLDAAQRAIRSSLDRVIFRHCGCGLVGVAFKEHCRCQTDTTLAAAVNSKRSLVLAFFRSAPSCSRTHRYSCAASDDLVLYRQRLSKQLYRRVVICSLCVVGVLCCSIELCNLATKSVSLQLMYPITC